MALEAMVRYRKRLQPARAASSSSPYHRVSWVRRDIGSVGLAQGVADAADGVQQGRQARQGELAAQRGHVHVDGVGLAEVVEAPDALVDQLAGQDAAGVLQEEGQQVVLAGGQADPPA